MRYLRLLSGVIAGYGAMALLITLVQERWFGGVGWYQSSMGVLAVAGFFTFLSAVVGGWFGTVVGGGTTSVVGRVMCLLVVTETSVLMLRSTLDGPLWFDVLAAGSLLLGILIGAGGAGRRSEPAAATA